MLEKMGQQCSKYVLLVDLRYLDIGIIIDYLVYDPRSYTKNQHGGTRLSRIDPPRPPRRFSVLYINSGTHFYIFGTYISNSNLPFCELT